MYGFEGEAGREGEGWTRTPESNNGRIVTCFLGGVGVVVAKILALYAFDRSYTL